MHRVVICDDHRLFGQALAQVLVSRGYDVVACTDRPDAGVSAVREHQPDVYITDFYFPDAADGQSGVAAARDVSPRTRVLVLSGSREREALEKSRDSGASGFVVKDLELEQIVTAIAAVARGEEIFHQLAASTARGGENGVAKMNDRLRFLTPREHEVLQRLVSGQDTATLAREMGVAYSTARTHIQNLLAKLGVHSKLEAVALVARHSRMAGTSSF